MREKLSRQFCVIAFVLLSGVVFGCCFILRQTQFPSDAVIMEHWFEQDGEALKLYSGFVFKFAIYLLLLLVFGMTVLGIVFIPAVIFIKGAALGITFTWMLRTIGPFEYIGSWLCFGAAAFCLVFLLLFALHAFRVSLKFCRQLSDPCDLGLLLRKFGVHFIFTFFMTAVSGGVYLLSVLCGNLI